VFSLTHFASPRLSRRLVLLTGLLAGIASTALPLASARAGVIDTNACDSSPLTQPFVPWLDPNQYKLVPNGSFERGAAGWTLKGRARVASGSDPYGVTGSVGSSSLYLPAGASAQSPFTCVNAAYPTLRLVGHNAGLLSAVAVQVVYQNPLGGQLALPVGVVALSPSWQPTLPMTTLSAVPGALNGGTAQVALRFTALTGTTQIDDVFIDPRMH
jgi:hypothetical protein